MTMRHTFRRTHLPRIVVASLMGISGTMHNAFAQTPPGLPPIPSASAGITPQQDPAQRLLDEQRSRELQRELDRQPAQIEVAPAASPQVPDLPADADIDTLPDPEPTFRIDRIVFKGDTVLSASELDRITAPFLHKSLGRRRIDLLMRRLTEAFVARGLITRAPTSPRRRTCHPAHWRLRSSQAVSAASH